MGTDTLARPLTPPHFIAGRPSPECPSPGHFPRILVMLTHLPQILSPTMKTLDVLLPHPPVPLLWGQDTPLRSVFIMTLRWATDPPVCWPLSASEGPQPGPTSSWPQAPSPPVCRFSGRSYSHPMTVPVSAPSSCHIGHFDLNVAVENAL